MGKTISRKVSIFNRRLITFALLNKWFISNTFLYYKLNCAIMMNYLLNSIYDLPLQCISSHQYYFLVEVFLKGNVCGEIFFIVFKICQAGWFIWRASTNPQIWQLFLQATSQVMTAHNLFAPSHSVVLPFGFILKLLTDANLAVHYCILSLRDKMIITFCQCTIG